MTDVGGLGVKLISVTILTRISLKGGGVGGGNVVRGGVGMGRGFFYGTVRYKTWMRDRKPAKAWDRVLEVKR